MLKNPVKMLISNCIKHIFLGQVKDHVGSLTYAHVARLPFINLGKDRLHKGPI